MSGVTLAALAAHTINNPSYSKLSGAFNRATPPIDIKSTQAVNSNKYALGRGDRFPTERRPEKRELSHESDEVIAEWFEKSQIHLGVQADTPEKRLEAKRLFYTWRDCFAENIRDIRATDLIEHSIDLKPGAHPVRGKIPRYNAAERAFANEIFPLMEDAGVIVRRSSEWGAGTKFPPKKKGSPLLRVVQNYIPLNKHTIRSQYPVHRLEETIDVVIKPGFKVFFSSDAANGYWGIPMKESDCNKTGFLTRNRQWIYLRMGQGLTGAESTYSQFSDIVFGPLPQTDKVPRMPKIIDTGDKASFGLYMDDHLSSARTFADMFKFLHETYFPRVVFGPVYLTGKKTFAFDDKLDILGFEGTGEGLRPSSKHRDKVKNWATPKNREELDAFLWLTPFLRIFIPGRADHVMVLKEAYLKKVPAEAKAKKQHHDELEECDLDLAKAHRSMTKPKTPTIRRTYIEKGTFDWGPRQEASFQAIKNAITNNAVAGADPNLQFHLTVDASQTGIGGILFQMKGVKPGTEAATKFAENERIVMFLSYRLTDAETRYGNSERECLAVVRCLTEIK